MRPASSRSRRSHPLELSLFAFAGSSWTQRRIAAAVRGAAAILAQCGVALEAATLYRLEGGAPEMRDLDTPRSRALARELDPARPAVFFVRDTRNSPQFEAEAFGHGNTATRPELAGTVWITAGIRDLPVSLAHELGHVLMDSGEHSEAPRNLMRADSAPENTLLTRAQCARMVERGTANGWLKP